MPSRAVGLRGINLEELPQRLNVVAPITAAYRGIQAHLNVRGTQRGKPLPNTTGESTSRPITNKKKNIYRQSKIKKTKIKTTSKQNMSRTKQNQTKQQHNQPDKID